MRYTLAGSKLAEAPGSVRFNTSAWANATLGVITSGSLDGSGVRADPHRLHATYMPFS